MRRITLHVSSWFISNILETAPPHLLYSDSGNKSNLGDASTHLCSFGVRLCQSFAVIQGDLDVSSVSLRPVGKGAFCQLLRVSGEEVNPQVPPCDLGSSWQVSHLSFPDLGESILCAHSFPIFIPQSCYDLRFLMCVHSLTSRSEVSSLSPFLVPSKKAPTPGISLL